MFFLCIRVCLEYVSYAECFLASERSDIFTRNYRHVGTTNVAQVDKTITRQHHSHLFQLLVTLTSSLTRHTSLQREKKRHA